MKLLKLGEATWLTAVNLMQMYEILQYFSIEISIKLFCLHLKNNVYFALDKFFICIHPSWKEIRFEIISKSTVMTL